MKRMVTIGVLMQVTDAFGRITGALSKLAEALPALNDFRSVRIRLLRISESKVAVEFEEQTMHGNHVAVCLRGLECAIDVVIGCEPVWQLEKFTSTCSLVRPAVP